MVDNLIDETPARIIADVLYNQYERDWMDLASCHVDHPDDTRFIRKPTPDEDDQWGAMCAKCPVFSECWEWAKTNDVSGVYVAGTWRS